MEQPCKEVAQRVDVTSSLQLRTFYLPCSIIYQDHLTRLVAPRLSNTDLEHTALFQCDDRLLTATGILFDLQNLAYHRHKPRRLINLRQVHELWHNNSQSCKHSEACPSHCHDHCLWVLMLGWCNSKVSPAPPSHLGTVHPANLPPSGSREESTLAASFI